MLKFILSFLVISNSFAGKFPCDRNDFGYNSKTRANVLTQRSQVPVKINNNGTVTYGKWFDQYTTQEFQGNPYPALEIDHIVPIQYAIENGACNWSNKVKKQFGTDFENLAITSKDYNRQKGSNICWLPYTTNKDIICDYLETEQSILDLYNLPEPLCLQNNLKKENCIL